MATYSATFAHIGRAKRLAYRQRLRLRKSSMTDPTHDFDFPINLDNSMDPQQLRLWACELSHAFDLVLPPRVRTQLAIYAYVRAMIIEERLRGEVAKAEQDERECDRLYNLLPPAYRW